MGRDLRLYTSKGSKLDLVDFIKSFGNIETTTHLWDWPKGSLHYYWFDSVDYKSTTGVEITIFPTENEHSSDDVNRWTIHVRNTYAASWHDINMLNTVLREGRKKFGGYIIGDYGKNRYAPLGTDTSTPMSRGVKATRSIAEHNIDAINYSLPPENPIGSGSNVDKQILNTLAKLDPARVIYNGLVPFLISIVEFYFKSIFIILLKYDPVARQKIYLYDKKVDFSNLLEKREPEEVIANNYTFQNLKQVKLAYSQWLGMDIELVLRKNKYRKIWEDLDDLIQYRHDIIHHLGVDTDLSHADFIKAIVIIRHVMEVLNTEIESKYNIEI